MKIKHILNKIFSQITEFSFAIEYWDGEKNKFGEGKPDFIVYFKDKNTCESLLENLSMRFGEGYMSGLIDIEGDFQKVMRVAYQTDLKKIKLNFIEKLKVLGMHWYQNNSVMRSKQNIIHHYDIGNDFFKLWLDKEMTYSCAYFRSGQESIDEAQQQKFKHICTKLRLKAGERLLDIGCGWGGLAIYAASNYNVEVLGITLSEEQKTLAESKIKELGLSDQVKIELLDYRELPTDKKFHKIVSVGMLEHVGKNYIPAFFNSVSNVIEEGGLGIAHTIGRMIESPTDPWLNKYIFPGAHLPSLTELAAPMSSQLEIIDVETLRMHYALTLERWLEAYEQNIEKVKEMYGESFSRMWRFYFTSCAAGFRYSNLTLWQIQFTKGRVNDLPLTREYMYLKK